MGMSRLLRIVIVDYMILVTRNFYIIYSAQVLMHVSDINSLRVTNIQVIWNNH